MPMRRVKSSPGEMVPNRDSDGTLKRCHCKRGASYCVIVSKHFYCMKVQLGMQKSVTVRGDLLTVSLYAGRPVLEIATILPIPNSKCPF